MRVPAAAATGLKHEASDRNVGTSDLPSHHHTAVAGVELANLSSGEQAAGDGGSLGERGAED
jgi:hypothetical protein